MVKKVKVQLFGLQNRQITVDADATEGATVERNLYWPDGSVVQESEIRGGNVVVQSEEPGGVGGISQTLWSLIIDIPEKLLGLLALQETGFVFHQNDVFSIDAGGGGGGATDWPLHKDFIGPAETLIIPASFQYMIHNDFDVQGNLDIEAGGGLWIMEDQPAIPEPLGPDFTYVSGDLTQIYYDAGEQKHFTYNVGGDLERLDFIRDGTTFRKDFFYTGGGDLDYVDEYYV